MSINIFQFLKDGTRLNRKALDSNTHLQSTIIRKQKQKNTDYLNSQKFAMSDSEEQQQPSTYDPDQLQQIAKLKLNKAAKLRKSLSIKVQGHDIPLPINNFTKIIKKYRISMPLIEGLSQLGFRHPTPVQIQVLPAFLQDRNVLVTAPTGTGKTLSYLLPILHHLNTGKSKFFKAIIIAPIQQLATQIMEQLKVLAGKIENVTYQCGSELNEEQLQLISKSKSPSINILVSTPLKFITLFQNHTKLLKHVKYLILDECDKYFQQSFFEQIKILLGFFQHYTPVYGLFSATIQHPVEQLLKSEFLDDCIRIQIGGKNHVLSKIEQSIEYCTNQYGKIVYLKNLIIEGGFVPPVLIFVQEKLRAKQLLYEIRKTFKQSIHTSKKVEMVTGDKSKEQRQQILNQFDSGKFWVLITTDLVARGIDFKNVNLVINYDFPNSILTYIHRVGRTGRADRQGRAITLFTDQDKPLLRSLANLLKVSGCHVVEWMLQLPKAHKKVLKKLQKYPTKRLPVGVAERRDKNWQQQLQKLQKKWTKHHGSKDKKQEKNDNNDQWQIVGPDQQ